ncbi:MAG: SH3 domain-containing protein, partial [Anaerolineae bacterium]
ITPTPITNDWPTYTNARYGFLFRYPPGAEITSEMDNYLYMNLPFVPGTTLSRKYLEVFVTENVDLCQSPLATLSILRGSENAIINGIPFLKQFGEEGVSGHLYKWTAYSTQQGNTCLSLDFIMKIVNPGVFLTPPPDFDEALESSVFAQMISTFAWIPATPTPSETPFETPTATATETPVIPPSETPSATPTPLSLLGPYAVRLLRAEEMLNIHAAPGNDQPIVGSFPANATNVMRTAATAQVNGNTWAEVLRPDGGSGWVEARYLTEYLTQEAFCADPRPQQIIAQLAQAMNTSNGDLFAPLVSPAYGVDVRLWAYASPVNFDQATARSVFTSTQVYNWGSGSRGEPEMGAFKDIIQPKMLEVLNAPALQTYCDSLTNVFPLARPWPYENVHFYHLYKPGTPGVDLDFRSWLIGFEYIDHQPYLFAMVTIVWEP